MKTAISLPDALFESADAFAEQTGRSRSQLYADALREYLERHDADQITASLDALAADLDTTVDPVLARASRGVLTRDRW